MANKETTCAFCNRTPRQVMMVKSRYKDDTVLCPFCASEVLEVLKRGYNLPYIDETDDYELPWSLDDMDACHY